MNLDIMSLMAASAAVAESSAKGGTEPGLPTEGVDRGEGEASFTDVLQMVIENSSTPLELEVGSATEAEGSLAEQISTVIDGRIEPTLAQGATPGLPADPVMTGGNLPPTGKDLPPAALPGDPLNPLQMTAQAELAATPAAPLAAQAAAAGVADAPASRPVVTADPLTPAKTGDSKTATTGWFSQTAPDADAQGPLMRAATGQASAGASSSGQTQQPTMPPLAAEAERSVASAAPTLSAARSAMQLGAKDEGGRAPVAIAAALQTESLAGPEGPRAVAAPTAVTAPTVSQPAAPIPGTAPVLNMAQAGWDQALGQRLVFMARNGLEKAELRLDPPQLGSINVKLAIQGEQAQLIMQAANPAAREVLEGALPRLREMLGSEGLQLGSAEVAERDTGGRERSASSDDRAWSAEHAETAETETSEQVVSVDHLTLPAGRIYEKV